MGAALDQIDRYDRADLSPAELIAVLREHERLRRRAATIDHGLVAEIDDRRVAVELCVPSTAMLLVRELRVSPGEAKARVAAALDLAPRRTPAGEVVAPIFAPVAAAQAAGVISAEHAAVIRRTIDHLTDETEASQGQWLEQRLVETAASVSPTDLARVAAQAVAALEPESAVASADYHDRHRAVTLVQRPNGSYVLAGTLTPECGALWRTTFDSLAQPHPAADGVRDPRTAEQRQHDALADVPALLLRAQALPSVGGVVATLLVTMTAEQVQSGAGYATTSHDELIPTQRVLAMAGDSQTMSVRFDAHGGVLDYGRTCRLAPPALRLALAARDRGCCFPDCDRPVAWCQAHHFVEWANGGPTSLDNMGLVCGFHHREFMRCGWQGQIINGVPHWIPPKSIDPSQRPRHNTRHHQHLKQ